MPLSAQPGRPDAVRSRIPARLDRLPWSPFHTRMVTALGVAWALDGLEITIASVVGAALTDRDTLNMSAAAVGATASIYLLGQVVGALVFGSLSDAWGRRRLFMITLGVYLTGTGLTAATAGPGTGWVIYLFASRFVAGLGIGGEYAAINSAIDELVPPRYRGRVDIGIMGTYWAGAAIATLLEVAVYNQFLASNPGLAWRAGFLLGPVFALVILIVRRNLPESPRWLIMHGRSAEAERNMEFIEHEVAACGRLLPETDREIEIRPVRRYNYLTLARLLFREHPRRFILCASMMIPSSFLYNALYFTYAVVLKIYFRVPNASLPWYGLAFALGNLAGPLTLGHWFDTIGRRPMIVTTYLVSGVTLAVSAELFRAGLLDATTQTAAWVIVFFFASAGTSAGWVTIGEIFPVEVRAQAIAVFVAFSQLVGAFAPFLYGTLINKDNPDPGKLFIGYAVSAALMIVGGITAMRLAIPAEGKPLEDVTPPLSAHAD
jgi:MFS family permease